MSARTTNVALRPGPICIRAGSIVISTPFGAIAALPDRHREPTRRDVRDADAALGAGRPGDRAERQERRLGEQLLLDGRTEIDEAGAGCGRIEIGALGRPDEHSVEPSRVERRAPLRENCGDTGGDRRRGARPADRSEPHLAVVAATGLGGRHRDTRSREVGLQRTGEHEPARRERGDRSFRLAAGNLDVSDRDRDGNAGGEHRPDLGDDSLVQADDGHSGRHVEAEGAGRKRPVDEHRQRAGRGRLLHRVVGERSTRKEHGAAGDGAHAVLGEETADSLRRGAAIDEHDIRGHGVRRSAAERNVGFVQDAKSCTHVHPDRRRSLTPVRGTDGDGVDRAARDPRCSRSPARRARRSLPERS